MAGITFFPSGGWNGGTVSGQATFAGEVDLDGLLTAGIQSFAENGGTIGTISASADPIVLVTGSGGGTLNLPASPPAGTLLWIRSAATSTFNLSGNGANIDASAAASAMAGGAGVLMIYVGASGWYSVGTSTLNAGKFSGSVECATTAQFDGRVVIQAQTFSGTGSISASGGSFITFTGTSGGTLTLPSSSLTTGQEYVIKDEGGNAGTSNITVSAGSNDIDGATTATIGTNYGSLRLRWSGTKWDTW